MLKNPGDIITGKADSYQIIERIGAGGMGAAFRAKATGTGDWVVVKQLLGPQAIGREFDYEYQKKSFRREAQILMANRNPGIVRGFELIEADEDELFFVMEAINGRDLGQELEEYRRANNEQPFGEEIVIPIGIETCNVIHYLHSLPGQIIYRDLKPENILWDSVHQQIRLIDFGTARFAEKTRKVTVNLGTEGYAPPELYDRNADVDFRSDVFTIGATLYHLLTGEPWEDPRYPTPSHFRGYEPIISHELRQIVLRAMARQPRERYPTAAAMKADLEALLPGEDEEAPITAPLPARPRNYYPILSCFCTKCGNTPRSDTAIYCNRCGRNGGLFHAVVLKVMPSNPAISPMELFLQGNKSLLGRTDPESGIFPDVDLARFDDGQFVSRRHAIIERKGTEFFLKALQTVNPSKVDGFEVSSNTTVKLNPGARLELADLVANFLIVPCVEKV